ncbi:MAG: NFYB/HAP3 family transcription factor subunit [Candidatus Bathyarchaeia archaeon]
MSSVKKIVEMEMSEFSSVNRVSSSALIALYDAILKHGRMIARRAVEYALREDRKTVSEDDIKRAIADILL